MNEVTQQIMLEVLKTVENINSCTNAISRAKIVFFCNRQSKIPEFTCNQLGFLMTISYLYTLYIERGKISIKFMKQRIKQEVNEEFQSIDKHLKVINAMRTYLQHSLLLENEHDLNTRDICDNWFIEVLKKPYPTNEEEWLICVNSILNETFKCLVSIDKSIGNLYIIETKDEIIHEWMKCIEEYIGPEQFDEVLSIAMSDMGKEALDIKIFRMKHYDSWMRDINAFSRPFDFSKEARKLVEYSLIHNSPKYIPINGEDIMEHFDMKPGIQVGEILKLAYQIYNENPCTKEELLQRLEEYNRD